MSPRHRRDRRSESDHRSGSGPAGPPSAPADSSPSIRGEVYARLEQTPFNRGVAVLSILAAGVVALLIMSGTFGGGPGPGAPLPEAVQSTDREPVIIGSVPLPSPSPNRPSGAGRSTVTASNVLRVPAADGAPRSTPGNASRPGPDARPPLWRHDPSQWGPGSWLWNPWPSDDDSDHDDHDHDHDHDADDDADDDHDTDDDADDDHGGRHSGDRGVQSGGSYGSGSSRFSDYSGDYGYGGGGAGYGYGYGGAGYGGAGYGGGGGAGWYGRR